MYALDASLDASLHGHGNARKARRRTSLDNGYLASTDLRMLVILDNNINSYHHKLQKGPRRLSLNNCTAMNTTFLANNNNYNVSTADKSDLDIDSHPSYHSLRSRTNSLDISKNGTGTYSTASTARGAVVSDVDGWSSSFDGSDCDSFCEATCTEPANQEYMTQDLGASCFWNDEEFFRQIENSGESLDYNDDHDFGGAAVKDPNVIATYLCMERQENMVHQKENSDHFDDEHDDDSSECDSFCDANANERANTEYLKKDLGASCFWSSTDDLLIATAENEETEHAWNASIRTITEEV
jgi:hypothetical protein